MFIIFVKEANSVYLPLVGLLLSRPAYLLGPSKDADRERRSRQKEKTTKGQVSSLFTLKSVSPHLSNDWLLRVSASLFLNVDYMFVVCAEMCVYEHLPSM